MHANGSSRRVIAVICVAAALSAGLAAPAAAGEWRGTGDQRRLQAAVDDLHGLGITGVQGLTRIDGRTSRARAGVGDLENGRPVPLNGYFRIGSTTKTFVAVTVLQLVGEGRLSLDDTVERWLPGVVSGNGNDGSRITVRQLLQHTSGIYNYTNDMEALASPDAFLAHRYDHWDPAELVALAMKHEPDFAPGTGWNYSNTNYVLAGMIIEAVTGRSWATETQARILGPLGLRHTSIPGDVATLPRPHARAYQEWADGEPLMDTTEFNPSAGGAAGSMISTTADIARFWQALQHGRLLGPQMMAEMQRTVLAETFQDFYPGLRYGLGIMFLPNRCGGYWSHGGDVPGVSTVNGVSPDGNRVAVLALTTQLASDSEALPVYHRQFHLLNTTICD
ncbi:serine hydrolase domain-containing protein [Allorhizocola rhizosphaerae]|uniref:serine hydrolase domain-containing protein n=1 Tax=Allorhizocola rhizosphaerae TaxID=1872709 RepID=UPI000E3CD403|nr:serine hydrolase domain-containing protein [Allorhizocola rhizosphaerae]